MQANNAETGTLGEQEFVPDFDRYLQMEEGGYVRLFTARDEGKLVGYNLMMISTHPHYPGSLWAIQDTLYMAPEWRGFASIRFIRHVDAELRAEGVKYLLRQVNVNRDFSRTLERMGYDQKEVTYMRRF
jgi:hypothetical protein